MTMRYINPRFIIIIIIIIIIIKEPLDGGPDPHGNLHVWGFFGTSKSIVSRCCVYTAAKKSITASARLLQPFALLPTGRCHINFSP